MQLQFRKRRSGGSFELLNAPIGVCFDAASRKRFVAGLFTLVFTSISIGLGHLQTIQAQTTQSGSSSRQSRNLAAQLIPYAQLNEDIRSKISAVVESASLYRRLPVNSIVADPEYFRFLVRYPEVVVNIWQLMGVTQMTTERTGPFTVDTDDGAGTVSTLDLIYGNENLHVFYGTGTYEGPVLKRKLNGRCVLVLRTDYRQDSLGTDLVVNQMDVFLKLDNVGASLMAKTIQPIVGPTADQNFLDSLKFIQRLNETTVDNGPGVQHMAGRMNIDEETRQKFIEAAGNCYAKATSKSSGSQQGPPIVPSLTSNPNQTISAKVGTAGYNHQTNASTLTPGRNSALRPLNSALRPEEYPIPAFQPPSSHAAPTYQSDSYSRQ